MWIRCVSPSIGSSDKFKIATSLTPSWFFFLVTSNPLRGNRLRACDRRRRFWAYRAHLRQNKKKHDGIHEHDMRWWRLCRVYVSVCVQSERSTLSSKVQRMLVSGKGKCVKQMCFWKGLWTTGISLMNLEAGRPRSLGSSLVSEG